MSSLGGGSTLGGGSAAAKKKKKQQQKKKAAAAAAGGSSLGGPPPAAEPEVTPDATPEASLAPASGASLGAPAGGASLGAPGGSSLGGSSLGGGSAAAKKKKKQQQKKKAAAAAAAAAGGSTLGGSSLGGPPPAVEEEDGTDGNEEEKPTGNDEAEAGGDAGGDAGAGDGASSAAAKKKKKKKKKKAAAEPAPKKMSKMAALIKAQQEEAERIRKEQEELDRIAEEEEKKIAEQEQLEEENRIEKARLRKEKRKAGAKTKKEKALEEKAEKLKRSMAIQKAQREKEAAERKIRQAERQAEREAEEKAAKEQEAKEAELAAIAAAKAAKEEEEAGDWENMYTDSDSDAEVEEEEEEAEEVAPEPKKTDLRSPICCVLGHVDTGKTQLLDTIRKTKVQKGEAGGITQQIGATYFPQKTIKEKTKLLLEQYQIEYLVPGLLIIDTPGHESFTNLRSRGSSLCDIAILVIDCMHGMEQQTFESLKLLKMRKTPFVVALNKIDRIYDWKVCPDMPIMQALEQQEDHVKADFEQRVTDTMNAMQQEGLNAQLYCRNKNVKQDVSIVPTSAISGEGIPDIIMLIVQLTQKLMAERLYISDTLKCSVLEVKQTEGFGYTLDVILIDGKLRKGDKVVLCGMNGPIVTTIKTILTPHPLKEIRVKTNQYQRHQEIRAAMGAKIVAADLQHALAGTELYVIGERDEEELLELAEQELKGIKTLVGKTKTGVYVQASSLGSLEALLHFLRQSKIPVAQFGIGTIHRRDVMQAAAMVDRDPRYSCMLAFDVKIDNLAQQQADELGVKIFVAPIIYHLEEMFMDYLQEIEEAKKAKYASEAVWPCILEIPGAEFAFNKRNPLVLGVEVLHGELRLGTPLAVPSRNNICLGRVTSIELDHKQQTSAGEGTKVAIKIEQDPGEQLYMWERHFNQDDELMSRITRTSLNRLKEFFGKDLTKKDIKLLKAMKSIYNID